MKFRAEQLYVAMVLALAAGAPQSVWAFTSGSTGVDGAFSPTANTELPLPPDGTFNFTTVNIPTGVKVTFKRNTTNTPAVILATGNVTIAGTLDASGAASPGVGTADGGNIGDDSLPGIGGPGGFDGGKGGATGYVRGGYGLGPGGGPGANGVDTTWFGGNYGWRCGGAGGSYGGTGEVGIFLSSNGARSSGGTCDGGSAATYGSTLLVPLIGGSGGGGGQGGTSLSGSGGGGGGGALLIASSGTVNVTGSILANGGATGQNLGSGCGSTGGGGSGGAIRVIATTISGNGAINASGGSYGTTCSDPNAYWYDPTRMNPGGSGGAGRIRLEAETFTRTAGTSPASTVTIPGAVFVSGLPTLRFVRVGGVDAPALPTGKSDVVLPKGTTNPVTIEFAATGVPTGNTIKLTVKAESAAPIVVTSSPLSGSNESSSASASVNLPAGPSVLQATVTYTVVASVGDQLGTKFAQGERVEKVTLTAGLTGSSMITLTTVSGKEYTVPSHMAAGVLGG